MRSDHFVCDRCNRVQKNKYRRQLKERNMHMGVWSLWYGRIDLCERCYEEFRRDYMGIIDPWE